MENKKNFIFWIIVSLVGIGLVSYSYLSKPISNLGSDTSVVSPSSSPSISSSPSPSISALPSEEPFLGLGGIKSPATCQIQGEVLFGSKDSFSSRDSKISWQNVDSQGRLIFWHISPKDNLAIGPNLFGNLTVPNGEYENPTVRLPENPIAKSYLLTASITYGQIIQGDVKVKETDCTGKIKVDLNF